MIVPCDVVDVPDVCCRCLIVPNDRLSSCRCNLCIAVTPLGQEIKSASRLNLRGTSEVNMNKDIIWFFEIEQILLRSLQLQHRDR
jgi:hypothetical protein